MSIEAARRANRDKIMQLQADVSLLINREDYYRKVIHKIRGGLSVVKLNVESPTNSEPCWIKIPIDKAISIVEEQLRACESQSSQVMEEIRMLEQI